MSRICFEMIENIRKSEYSICKELCRSEINKSGSYILAVYLQVRNQYQYNKYTRKVVKSE